MLYIELPLKSVQRLQLVQNVTAHLLMGVGQQKHITLVLQHVYWLNDGA